MLHTTTFRIGSSVSLLCFCDCAQTAESTAPGRSLCRPLGILRRSCHTGCPPDLEGPASTSPGMNFGRWLAPAPPAACPLLAEALNMTPHMHKLYFHLHSISFDLHWFVAYLCNFTYIHTVFQSVYYIFLYICRNVFIYHNIKAQSQSFCTKNTINYVEIVVTIILALTYYTARLIGVVS